MNPFLFVQPAKAGSGGGSGGPFDPLGSADQAVATHKLEADAHPQYAKAVDVDAQYLKKDEANLDFERRGAASDAIAAHVATSDPHAQYLTEARANALYANVNAAGDGLAAHVAASDPHAQYMKGSVADAKFQPIAANLTAWSSVAPSSYSTTTQMNSAIAAAIDAIAANANGVWETILDIRAALTDNQDAVAVLTNAIAAKQSPATTLAGYGITNAYTKTEVDAKVTVLNNTDALMAVVHSGTTNPTAAMGKSTNDTALNPPQAYKTGHVFINTTTKSAFLCVDDTQGAAVWLQLNNIGPSLESVSPLTSVIAGGVTVTLTGQKLTGVTAVTFDGVQATAVTVVNDTTITCKAPAHAAGSVAIRVENAAGQAASKGGAFTYVAAPAVTSLNVIKGAATGSTNVTITGSGFTGATSVKFDTLDATNVSVVNDTTITCRTPAHAAGAVGVSVTTAYGTGTRAAAFTYVAAPSIASLSVTSGDPAGGTAVTITGTGFTDVSAVTFGGQTASSIVVLNDTTITCRTPARPAGAVDCIVTTLYGSATQVSAFTYVVPAVADVTFLAQSALVSGSGTTLSDTINLGVEAPDRYIIVGVTKLNGTPAYVTSISIAGVVAGLLKRVETDGYAIDFYIAKVPNGTSGAVSITYGGASTNRNFIAWRMVNADPIPFATGGNLTAIAVPSLPFTIDTPANGAIIAFGWGTGTGLSTWTGGVTKDCDTGGSGVSFTGFHINSTPAQTARSFSLVPSGSARCLAAALSFAPKAFVPSPPVEFLGNVLSPPNPVTAVDTYTIQLGAEAADRHIAIAIAGTNVAAGVSATINGIACTLARLEKGSQTRAAILCAKVPTGTSGTLVVTWSEGAPASTIGIYRLTGINGPAPYATIGGVDTASISGSLAVPAGGVAIGVQALRDSVSNLIWAGLTEDADVVSGSNHRGSFAHATGTGTLAITGSGGAAGVTHALVCASWAPAS
ncbi:IPT/TIG domain-containing protein [Hyphomicrobium sp.]|uniref:IPT/TIG domain-containing protein n=1 Tax=Hyphomicrobium sp. TaxID=82 RepID=UPI001D7BEC39|nr:IPT/TIG domain-containing protein [Hyphomicrobium sp.]MBY0560139.1 IPT/TIG domain-containing protein [Hyphomicrobium sp.]